MNVGRMIVGLLLCFAFWIGTTTAAHAEYVACGELFVPTYAPVVSKCMQWGVMHFPSKPTFKDGRWVINDDGLEFTLMYNAENGENGLKDETMKFFAETGIQIRYGVAQPLDNSEPTPDYLESHTGMYVETGYAGDWQRNNLPSGR